MKRAIPLSQLFRTIIPDGQLRSRGENEWMGRCPFHEDDSPSLAISDKRGVFYCFGCGATGDIFEAEKRARGLGTLPETLSSLAQRFPAARNLISNAPRSFPVQVSPQLEPLPVPPAPIDWNTYVTERRKVGNVLNFAIDLYRKTLHSDVGKSTRAYLEQRGVSAGTQRAFLLGCSGPETSWDYGLKALRAAGFEEELCIGVGVAGKSQKGRLYDAFRGRLVFPICDDEKGDIIAIAGRVLKESKRAPKYVNSCETILFKKKRVLFGAHFARNALLAKCPKPKDMGLFESLDGSGTDEYEFEEQVEEEDAGEKRAVLLRHAQGGSTIFEQFLGLAAASTCLVVVEGYMDVLALYEHSNGTFPVVASMGTAVSVAQVKMALDLLPDLAECSIIFNFDRDEAGLRAAERLCDSVLLSLPEAFRVFIAFPPDNVKDVDQYLNDKIGTADDYMIHLQETATIWPMWRGQRIVDKELARIEEESPRNEPDIDPTDPEALQALIDRFMLGEGSLVDDKNGHPKEETDFADDSRLVVEGLPRELSETSEGLFNFQLEGEFERATNRMMRAFGAPKNEIKSSGQRQKKHILRCSPAIVEELANFLARAERTNPGINSSELILSWSDQLCERETAAIPALFQRIANRTDEINVGWKPAFADGMDGMPTPPWILDELSPNTRERVLTEENHPDYLKLTQKRLKALRARIQQQKQEIEERGKAKRGQLSKRIRANPRVAAEERVLRALVRCPKETDRLEALEKSLAVMVAVEERGGRFWTNDARTRMFETIGSLEGDVPFEEIAALCEGNEWFGDENLAYIFTDGDEDDEWTEVMGRDIEQPIWAAETGSLVIEQMEDVIAGRRATRTNIAAEVQKEIARERGDFDTMDSIAAKQMLAKRALRRASAPTEEERQMIEAMKEEKEKEFEEERIAREILAKLERGEELPFTPIPETKEE